MNWKKLIDSKELIILEGSYNESRIKIEARLNENNEWSIYQIRIKGDSSSLIKEFSLKKRSEVVRVLKALISEKNPLRSNIYRKTAKIELKRLFKEELVEKWGFSIANEKQGNFIYVLYGECVKADVVMHERYRMIERSILSAIEERLSLRDFSDEIIYDVYYFRESSHTHVSSPASKQAQFSDVYIQFGVDSGEE